MHIAGEAAEDGETGFGWAARADNTVSSPLHTVAPQAPVEFRAKFAQFAISP
ncbi:hypothetical protein [Rhizobium rhizogenes]|uniref:Uncharacterized protein n=1 Tax=Rhizobium rhizogenes NBRC 13257 TaxID=1220581 RepID=A0AA87U7U3_RHIRH|nr:hypothetical protein [Rhizobium rhizogenes]WEO67236.1 hypothetical protein G6L54_017100 [Rhizobium rhizogenes]GAJ97122.1 hypothetical protein RRH01S_33_00060 [Rhizobium rhizogenes NBRC 13257]